MRAIVYGLRKETINNQTTTLDGENCEATLVRQIGNAQSDVWEVHFDDEPRSVTRTRRVRRMLP